MYHTEAQVAAFKNCLSSTTCGSNCETVLTAAIDRLDCCVTNLDKTENIEMMTRGCPAVNTRVKALIAAGVCPIARAETKVPIEVALPIKWSVIANNVAMQKRLVESSTRDISNAIGIDPQFIVDGRLEIDVNSQVSSSTARRRLLQSEAGTRFAFSVQASSNAITTSAATSLTNLLKTGIAFPSTATFVATECPQCGNPALLISVKAPSAVRCFYTHEGICNSGSTMMVSALLMLIVTVLLAL
jgi:hypothetical protein